MAEQGLHPRGSAGGLLPPILFPAPATLVSTTADIPPQGLRANRGQIILLLVALALAVTMTGPERSVLPVVARQEFGVGTAAATLSFLVAFGLSKAIANLFAGQIAERLGRTRVLMLGWVAALPVAPMIIAAPSWGWVVAANVPLGIASSFIWFSSVVMRLDLAGPERRGFAMGLSGIGPIFLGLSALLAGWLAHGYGARPLPFVMVGAAAVLGLLLAWRVRDTDTAVAAEEKKQHQEGNAAGDAPNGFLPGLLWCSWTKRELFVSNQAGLTLNMTDGVVWGIFPLFLTQQGLGLREVGVIAGAYPIVVGLAETSLGPLSDRWSRRPFIAGGMLLMAAGMLGFALADRLAVWIVAVAIMGLGYAAAFPCLSAQIGDLVAPRSRPRAIGVYRMWRDLGHAVGGLTAGLLADLIGLRGAMLIMATVLVGSALFASHRLPGRDPSGAR